MPHVDQEAEMVAELWQQGNFEFRNSMAIATVVVNGQRIVETHKLG